MKRCMHWEGNEKEIQNSGRWRRERKGIWRHSLSINFLLTLFSRCGGSRRGCCSIGSCFSNLLEKALNHIENNYYFLQNFIVISLLAIINDNYINFCSKDIMLTK